MTRHSMIGMLLVAVVSGSASAQTTWYVDVGSATCPGDGSSGDPYCWIQDAIIAASNTDTVEVAVGTYYELIDFLGKAITVRSTAPPRFDASHVLVGTVIHGGSAGSVVTCAGGEGPTTVLDGFIITDGSGTPGGMFGEALGGGMYIALSSPTVKNCAFLGNSAWTEFPPEYWSYGIGGGMFIESGSPYIANCIFWNNWSVGGGGIGIFGNGDPTVVNCVFRGNSTVGIFDPFMAAPAVNGGGILVAEMATVTVSNCTFVGNGAGVLPVIMGSPCNYDYGDGGGIYFANNAGASIISNSIFYQNNAINFENINFGTSPGDDIGVAGLTLLWDPMSGDQLECWEWMGMGTPPTVSYTDEEEGFWSGTGNIHTDPLFEPFSWPDNPWHTSLSSSSPCIDAASNTAVRLDGADLDDDTNTGEQVPLDLALVARFMDGPVTDTGEGTAPIVDMGALEYPCVDTDSDGDCDSLDDDDDNDCVLDGVDTDPLDPTVCEDSDGDNCDDCSVGTDGLGELCDNDPANDGTDTDGDDLCDAGDDDDDGDCVLDVNDDGPLDATVCEDSDADTCDDCSQGALNVCANPDDDGTDTNSDGECDAGDPDDDGDCVDDGDDDDPLDPTVCRDLDGDGCDDCSQGGFDVCPNPNDDGTDTDSDGDCDLGDTDDDNDCVLDGVDNAPLDPTSCEDSDGDTCDDCSQAPGDFLPACDNDPDNDGTDTDGDGICDAGDNCVDVANPGQEDCQPSGEPGYGIGDACDVDPTDPDGDGEVSGDCNTNGVPDECEISVADGGYCTVDCDHDCNANGIPDSCDLADCDGSAWCGDCNGNSKPDECDIADLTSDDCQPNDIPDECETDCDGNTIPDDCDIRDCAGDPACDDCNNNDIPDGCDVADCAGDPACDDCNSNNIPDSCDIDPTDPDENGEVSGDCQPNDIPDECELVDNDCNTNSVPDECDDDCNSNSVPDECDLMTTEWGKLTASDADEQDQFGISVSMSGDVALVGAIWAFGADLDSGSAYVFRWNGTSWVEEAELITSDGATEDYFGKSVSISGDVALVGAYGDDDAGTVSGSAHVFRYGQCPLSACSVSNAACDVDEDCPTGACSITTEASCHQASDCPQGVCSGAGTPCYDGTDCPAGSCSGSPTDCWTNTDCPAGTCSGSSTTCWLDTDCPTGRCTITLGSCRSTPDCPQVGTCSQTGYSCTGTCPYVCAWGPHSGYSCGASDECSYCPYNGSSCGGTGCCYYGGPPSYPCISYCQHISCVSQTCNMQICAGGEFCAGGEVCGGYETCQAPPEVCNGGETCEGTGLCDNAITACTDSGDCPGLCGSGLYAGDACTSDSACYYCSNGLEGCSSPGSACGPWFLEGTCMAATCIHEDCTAQTCWIKEAKLAASDAAEGDRFGTSVSISGDVAIVGANGDDDNGIYSGSAYVFRWNGTAWVEEAKLTPSDASMGDSFGLSVTTSGDVAVVGSHSEGAYVFRWNGMTWVEEAKLVASDSAEGDYFGHSVAVSGDTVIVGASGDDDNGQLSGSAYVFRLDGIAWVEEAKLTASDAAQMDQFGSSVAIDGAVAVVGVPGDDDNGNSSGSGYVFRFNGTNWVEDVKLTASDGATADLFGNSVAVSSGVVLAGALHDDDAGYSSGSAYVYVLGSVDCNANTVPDECELDGNDCQPNGVPDECELTNNDCNTNDVPDLCDIRDCAGEPACGDCQLNGIPDGCEADCNTNTVPDDCDIRDCAGDPACEDCDNNGIPDGCDLADCASDPACDDCNTNGVPDGCDITSGAPDNDTNGIPDECEASPPALPPAPHNAPKNRYISIDPTTSGDSEVAIELRLASMKRCTGDYRRACVVDGDCPDVCDLDHNLQCTSDTMCGGDGPCVPTVPCVEHPDVGAMAMWIDEPFVSEAVPLGDCGGQWFAHLTHTAVYRSWTEDILHVTDCAIVPTATYEARSTPDGLMFTDALIIGTIPKPQVHYGDCVGPVENGSFTPADGFANVTDVQAYLIANQGGASAPHTTWVDLHSSSSPVVPQQILNVGDLQTIKFGFLGQTYCETPGHEDPGDCP